MWGVYRNTNRFWISGAGCAFPSVGLGGECGHSRRCAVLCCVGSGAAKSVSLHDFGTSRNLVLSV